MKLEPADRIVRAILALGRQLRSARPRGAASLSALGLLGTLDREGPMPASRLAAEEHLQPQSLTRLVASLERAGWIGRTRNTADRREISIAITPRGRRVLGDELRARRSWLSRAIAAALTPDERAALLDATDVMLKLVAHGDATERARSGRRRAAPRVR